MPRTIWADPRHVAPAHWLMVENLVPAVSSVRVQSLLDVGCGSGDNRAALAAAGRCELTVADLSREALSFGKRHVLTRGTCKRTALR